MKTHPSPQPSPKGRGGQSWRRLSQETAAPLPLEICGALVPLSLRERGQGVRVSRAQLPVH